MSPYNQSSRLVWYYFIFVILTSTSPLHFIPTLTYLLLHSISQTIYSILNQYQTFLCSCNPKQIIHRTLKNYWFLITHSLNSSILNAVQYTYIYRSIILYHCTTRNKKSEQNKIPQLLIINKFSTSSNNTIPVSHEVTSHLLHYSIIMIDKYYNNIL